MMDVTSKPTNPKDIAATTRIPLSLCSPIAKAHWALGQFAGLVKYGAWNWRSAGVRSSVYTHAIDRHRDAYLSGEEYDPTDGTHHLGNIMACCAILLDAKAAGKLVDDRPPALSLRSTYAELEALGARLITQYADRRPRHFTIDDFPPETNAVRNVVVGALVRKGRIFLQRRPVGDENFPGMWECPGGGIERGETDAQALARELREENGITSIVCPQGPIWRGQIAGYGGGSFDFRFYLVTEFEGTPRLLDGQPSAGWFRSVRGLAVTPANALAWPTIERALRCLDTVRPKKSGVRS